MPLEKMTTATMLMMMILMEPLTFFYPSHKASTSPYFFVKLVPWLCVRSNKPE